MTSNDFGTLLRYHLSFFFLNKTSKYKKKLILLILNLN